MKRIVTIILSIIAGLFFITSIGIMLMATIAQKNNHLLYVFDTSFSLIPSESMIGEADDSLDQFDMAIITKKPYQDLNIGDVIVFQSRQFTPQGCVSILKIHRIVGGDTVNGFLTKGDNDLTNPVNDQDASNCPDPRITETQYQGTLSSKVTFLRPLVRVIVQSRNIIFPIVIFILLIILFIEVIHLVKEFHNEKKKKLEEEQEAFKKELEEKRQLEYEKILKEEQEKLKK